MRRIIYLSLLPVFLIPGTSCTSQGQPQLIQTSTHKYSFKEYWYQGKAEITSYDLQQSRYGELHEGHAVLVYVTEDFSRKKQVKLDQPARAGTDKVPILKLNFSKKFLTGIYPYSMFTSVFTPVDISQDSHSMKITTSVQEWCGHTYTQLNLNKNSYQLKGFSYFESEGDQQEKLPLTWTEEEIWTRIRIDPHNIPTGNVDLIPSQMVSRLLHSSFQPQSAEISRGNTSNKAWGESSEFIRILYPATQRELVIYYQVEFPYQIQGWEETYRGLTTTARKKSSLMTTYWSQHNNRDREMREKLGL